jgi:hypothetical protein
VQKQTVIQLRASLRARILDLGGRFAKPAKRKEEEDLEMSRTITYTFISFQLNSLLDEGLFLDYKEIARHLKTKTVFDLLKQKFGQQIDLSIDAQELREISDLFFDLYEVVNEQRKFGVSKNGISLVLAYCIEGIQQEYSKNRQYLPTAHNN